MGATEKTGRGTESPKSGLQTAGTMIRMTLKKPLKTALRILKTMAYGYIGAAAAGLVLGIYGGLTGMTNAPFTSMPIMLEPSN